MSTERLAIDAAARMAGEVSKLRTELAACTDAYDRITDWPCTVHELAAAFADAFDALDGDVVNLGQGRFAELVTLRSVLLTKEEEG